MDFEYDKMKADYKREAKLADRRLRDLERAAKKYKSDKYLEYGYARAMRDMASHGLGNRFDKVPPKDPRILQQWLADVKRFNESPTNTYSGFRELDNQRYSTLSDPKNKKAADWFPDLTESEFLKITQLGVWDLLSDDFGFGYKTALKIAKALTGNKKYIMNRKSKMTFDRMENILRKFKFSKDPDLAVTVAGKIAKLDEIRG